MRGGKFLEIMVCLLGLKKLHMKLCIFVLVCLELSKNIFFGWIFSLLQSTWSTQTTDAFAVSLYQKTNWCIPKTMVVEVGMFAWILTMLLVVDVRSFTWILSIGWRANPQGKVWKSVTDVSVQHNNHDSFQNSQQLF